MAFVEFLVERTDTGWLRRTEMIRRELACTLLSRRQMYVNEPA